MPLSSMAQALEQVVDEKNNVNPGWAVAINPEKVISAYSNPEVKNSLLEATLRFADGVGVKIALERKSGEKLSRIPGCDFWLALMELCSHSELPVFILGATKEVNLKTVEKLKNQGVNVVGSQDGYFNSEQDVIEAIVDTRAKIIAIALGSPKQELLIRKCRARYPDAFYMGVGGSFDVFVGKVKRAPVFWQKMGAEWLYRLLSEPTRFKRQLNLVKFIWLMYRNKL